MTDTDVAVAVQAMQAQYDQGYEKAIFASTWGEAYKIGFETAVLAMTEQMKQEQAEG
jgi:hypothetical protein